MIGRRVRILPNDAKAFLLVGVCAVEVDGERIGACARTGERRIAIDEVGQGHVAGTDARGLDLRIVLQAIRTVVGISGIVGRTPVGVFRPPFEIDPDAGIALDGVAGNLVLNIRGRETRDRHGIAFIVSDDIPLNQCSGCVNINRRRIGPDLIAEVVAVYVDPDAVVRDPRR